MFITCGIGDMVIGTIHEAWHADTPKWRPLVVVDADRDVLEVVPLSSRRRWPGQCGIAAKPLVGTSFFLVERVVLVPRSAVSRTLGPVCQEVVAAILDRIQLPPVVRCKFVAACHRNLVDSNAGG